MKLGNEKLTKLYATSLIIVTLPSHAKQQLVFSLFSFILSIVMNLYSEKS